LKNDLLPQRMLLTGVWVRDGGVAYFGFVENGNGLNENKEIA